MTHFKLIAELERDIRNQVLFNNMLRTKLTSSTLPLKEKIMITFRRYPLQLATTALSFLWIIACMTIVKADDLHVPCPTPGEACKVLILSPTEERILTGQNGILDTAAQARSLDLGQFAVYLKTKIASAPAGEVQKIPEQPKSDAAPAK
jgi:hypothetical protein